MKRLRQALAAAILFVAAGGTLTKAYFDDIERAQMRTFIQKNPEYRPLIKTIFDDGNALAYIIGRDGKHKRICRCIEPPCDTADPAQWRLFGAGVGGVLPGGAPATCDPLSCTLAKRSNCGPYAHHAKRRGWGDKLRGLDKESALRLLKRAVRQQELSDEGRPARDADKAAFDAKIAELKAEEAARAK